ncbi:hypothetical protein BU17DRAFT_83913 [Hysterangium stoloniferum]|nr:hypothetical protein BU17DRAFT_83913 [Hysterangium stoloniferum]
MFAITVLMYILATAHLMINLARLLRAFSVSQTQPGAAQKILSDFSSLGHLMRSGVLLMEILLGDIVLIYRCYVAWGGSLRVIVLPSVLILGSIASGGCLVYEFSTTSPQSNIFGLKELQASIITTQALVLGNNVLCTSLITWKLWSMSRAMASRAQRQSLLAVAKIIAESGILTALTWLIWIILNALHQRAHVIVLNSLAPITGGAYCLIVSRVALGYTGKDGEAQEGLPIAPITTVLDGSGHRLRPVEITVSSRESIRVETEMDVLYKDKMALARLSHL